MPKKYISRAPGRICLFGDHQDYLNLPVIALAIDRHIEIQAIPNVQRTLNIRKMDLDETQIIDIDAALDDVPQGDFLRLALKVLSRFDCIPDLGFDIVITGNIPINAGLSSSSALTVAWIQFLVTAFGIRDKVNSALLARLAYETEVLETGSSGGKMDQYTISYGNLIYLDTAEDRVQSIDAPLDGLVIGVSGVAKDTFGTLATLKQRAWQAIHQVMDQEENFDIAKARESDVARTIPFVDSSLKKIYEAAILNHGITLKAKNQLQKNRLDFVELGDLINQHHQLLRDNLKITVPRIDAMIDGAQRAGALGAKIVGSGGGGCIVALCPAENQEAVIAAMKAAGAVDAFAAKRSGGPTISQIEI